MIGNRSNIVVKQNGAVFDEVNVGRDEIETCSCLMKPCTLELLLMVF